MILQLHKRKMAIAGMVMTTYLLFHMLSNLSFFCETTFNSFYAWYNAGLRWPVLVVMVVAIAIHVKAAIKIRKVNAKARRVQYRKHDKFHVPAPLVTISIILLLAFMVMHIIQTLLFDSNNVYMELQQLFQSAFMVLLYLAGLFLLMMHLSHSLANVLQTMGKTSVTCHALVWASVLLLVGGFAIIPLSIFWATL